MPSFIGSAAGTGLPKPASDFNCGWSAVHFLAAMSVGAEVGTTPTRQRSERRPLKLVTKSGKNVVTSLHGREGCERE